jgi:hypothetical protein
MEFTMKRNKSYKAVSICLLFLTTVACSSTQIAPVDYKYREFKAPIATSLTVDTGNELFVRGAYIEGEAILIKEQVKKLIPGAMGIPFPITIDPGKLTLRSTSSNWKYFCGEIDKVAASFPGLGSVIRSGDCVGIRISGNKMQWVVDNSNYNGFTTIYKSNIKNSEINKYSPTPNNQVLKAINYEKIIFEGFYGGQVYFEWEKISQQSKESRQFIFDFNGDPTIVGIKGQQFKILDVNNVELKYEWVKIKPSM